MPRSLKDLQASARALTRANCAALERLEKRWTAPPPVDRPAEDVVLFQTPRQPTPIHKVVPPPARSAEDQLLAMAQAYSEDKSVGMDKAVAAIAKQHPDLWQARIAEQRAAQHQREQPPQPASAVQKETQPRPPLPYERLLSEMQRSHPTWTLADCEAALAGTVEGRRARIGYDWYLRYGRV
jgi:hypothetical protein